MATVAKIQAELDLDAGKFTGTITSATGALKKFNSDMGSSDRSIRNMERRITGLGASLRDTMVILGQFRGAMHTLWAMTGQWVASIIDANAKLERMQMLMKGLSRSTTEIGKVTDSIRDMNYVLDASKNAPFAIDQIANSFVKLKASGLDPMAGSLQSIMDATAAFGGDSQVFARATLAIQQMAGKGVISMEELRQQLGEAMPNAMQMMSAATSMSMGELVKIISLGRLEANGALAKLFLEMKYQYEGSADAMMTTWTGSIQKLKTEWILFAKEIGNGGLFEEAKSALNSLITYMGSADGRAFARDIGQTVKEAGRAAVDLVNWLIRNRQELVTWGKLIVQVFAASFLVKFGAALVSAGVNVVNFTRTIGGLTTAMAAARAGTMTWSAALAAAAGPIGIAITAITALVIKLWDNERAARAAGEAMQRYYNASANGVTVSAEEHQMMQERLDYLRRVKKATDDYNASNKNQYSRARYSEIANDLMIEGRDKGFIQDWGNSMNDRFRTVGDKMTHLSKMQQANIGAAITAITQQTELQNARAAEQLVADYGERISKIAQESGPQIRNQLNDLNERLRVGELTPEQHRKERTALINTRLDATISAYQQARNNLQMRLAGMSEDEEDYQTVVKLIDETNKQLEAVYAEREVIEADVALMPKMGGDGKGKANPLRDYYESVIGKVAQLQGVLEDANPTLERFEAQLAAGKYGKNPDSGMVGQVRVAIEEIQRLNDLVKKDKATEALKQELEEMQAKTSADVISAQFKASGELYSQVSAGMVGFNRQVEVMRASLDKTNMSTEEFEASISKIKETLMDMEIINLGDYVKNREWDAYLDSLPKRARDMEEFNRQLHENALLRRNMHANDPNGENRAQIDALADRLDAATRQEYANATKPAFVSLLEDWQDVTTSIDEMWANSMERVADSIADGVVSGKVSFKSLADYMLKEITRILLSKAVAKLVELIIGFGGWGGSTTPVQGNQTTGINSGVITSANGNAFNNSGLVTAFAKGGAFTNSIVDEPTMAPMALFGEAGAEAIMPLSRDSSGRLGVSLNDGGKGGGSGGVVNDVDIQIVIQDGKAGGNSAGNSDAARELGKTIDNQIRQVLMDETRAGGIIWRSQNGR